MNKRICGVAGCELDYDSLGFCQMHAARFRRHGDPLFVAKRPNGSMMEDMEKILAAPPSDTCMEMMTGRDARGYVTVQVDGRRRKATHIILERSRGPRPSPEHGALHSCDNPPCCNPLHLRWGTQFENAGDRDGRNRRTPLRGEDVTNSVLTELQVAEIRALYGPPRGRGVRGGVTMQQLADRYGVSRGLIGHVVRRNAWNH